VTSLADIFAIAFDAEVERGAAARDVVLVEAGHAAAFFRIYQPRRQLMLVGEVAMSFNGVPLVVNDSTRNGEMVAMSEREALAQLNEQYNRMANLHPSELKRMAREARTATQHPTLAHAIADAERRGGGQ
jgi:hypothetical protein